ncbi:hypothetical protein Cme02nite_23010 [Catellatospora methionotrophica]|uniref:DUF2637 domain-containing protein n=1 Tax=Catellatospora methionotrophica TaxID=121620 RepID=A0A8J3PES5_9ACTN|nr:hypothetical protein [Catellatospora methionotrophica]GIG13969.1 hypothetical protein Cme02nite_23010 [Catellatospora methionotrophica]
MNTDTRGRGWSRFGALLGGVISVAANVAHSYIPPAGAPADWQPMPGAVVGSIVWPVILFVAIEILVRVAWPVGRQWAVLRFGGMIPVALVAGVVSYRHLSSLLTYYGEDRLVSALGPLAIDGLMIMATGALLVIGHRTSTTTATDTNPTTQDAPDVRPRPRPQDVPAPSPASLPVPDERPQPVPAVPETPPAVPVVQDRPEPVPAVPAAVVRAIAPVMTNVPALGGRVSDWPAPPLPADLLDRARAAAAEHEQANGRPITRDELRAVLRVSNDTTGQIMRALGLTAPRTSIASVNGTPLPEAAR